MSRTLSIWLVGLTATLPGCLMRDVDTAPAPQVAVPATFAEPLTGDEDPGRWWQAFDDVELNRAVDGALEHNLQLKQAWARLDQAKAMERMASAGLFPRIDASVSAGRSQSAPRVIDLGPPAGEQTLDGVQSNAFGMSLPVSYELDVWGRVRAGKFAAEEDREAFRADVETVATTLAANVVERWFDMLEQRSRMQLIDDQMRTNKLFLELVELRFGEGQVALSDVYQQQQQLQGLQAQRELVVAAEQVAQQQLAVLLGRTPNNAADATEVRLPEPPALPSAGIPATMLQRRPDLRAAQRRVVAADYRIAQAIAARFPTMSLTGSVGFSATDLTKLFEGFVWNFLGSISASVWDGGALSAQVDRSKAVLDERVYAYGDALLTALLEVESTLARERQQRKHIEALRRQVGTAESTVEAARNRFVQGDATFLPTLTALTSLATAEQNLLGAQRQLLSLRVQLYRALGSRWTNELKAPDPEQAPSAREKDS